MSKPKEQNELKVFFIVSHQTNLDEKIKYSLEKRNGYYDLTTLSSEIFRYNNRENFTIKIYSFNFKPSELLDKYQDKKTKKYKVKIILSNKGYMTESTFYGLIFIKQNRHNFIYDLKFQTNSWFNKQPPISLNLKPIDQFLMYEKLLKKLKLARDENLYNALLLETQNLFFIGQDKKFYLEFFLEVFKRSYRNKLVGLLLMAFKPEKLNPQNNFKIEGYINLLNSIGNKLTIITNKAPKCEKYY